MVNNGDYDQWVTPRNDGVPIGEQNAFPHFRNTAHSLKRRKCGGGTTQLSPTPKLFQSLFVRAANFKFTPRGGKGGGGKAAVVFQIPDSTRPAFLCYDPDVGWNANAAYTLVKPPPKSIFYIPGRQPCLNKKLMALFFNWKQYLTDRGAWISFESGSFIFIFFILMAPAHELKMSSSSPSPLTLSCRHHIN